jgi:hypothetical protein
MAQDEERPRPIFPEQYHLEFDNRMKEIEKMLYILEDGVVKRELDIIKWSEWHCSQDRRIDFTRLPNARAEVVTSFIGVDSRPAHLTGTPIVFETMVFGGEFDHRAYRYASLEDAQAGHLEVCKMIQNTIVHY